MTTFKGDTFGESPSIHFLSFLGTLKRRKSTDSISFQGEGEEKKKLLRKEGERGADDRDKKEV